MAIKEYRGQNNQKYYTHDYNTRTNKKDFDSSPFRAPKIYKPIMGRNLSKKAIETENLSEMRLNTDF